VEKRDADNFAYAMALGPGVASHADFKCLLEPMPRLAWLDGWIARPKAIESRA